MVGPMVTNPGTRDWTVTASLFATLNEMYGNRTVCGIGRGDSALRVLGAQPQTLGQLREAIQVIQGLANGEKVDAARPASCSSPGRRTAALEVWVAAYGPKALALTGEVGDGYILQLADPDIAAWMIERGAAGGREGRAGTRWRSSSAWRRPAYVGDDLAHQRDQTRWFGGMVGNHVADIVARYGARRRGAAGADRLHQGPAGLRLRRARPGRQHATPTFVPDEVVDRFCILGPGREPPEAAGASCAALGVDQFAVYLQHDDKEATLAAYGEQIIPALVVRRVARRSLAGAASSCVAALGGLQGWSAARTGRCCSACGSCRAPTTCPCRTCGRAAAPRPAGAHRRPAGLAAWCCSACLFTLGITAAGSSPARLVGLLLAVAMQRFRIVERGLLPYVILSQTVPLVALAPLIAGWSGSLSRPYLADWMTVAVIAAYLAFFPVAVGMLRGLQSPRGQRGRADAQLRRRLVAHAGQAPLPGGAALPVPGAAAGRRGRRGRRGGRRDLHRHARRHRPPDHRVLPGGHLAIPPRSTPPCSARPCSAWSSPALVSLLELPLMRHRRHVEVVTL